MLPQVEEELERELEIGTNGRSLGELLSENRERRGSGIDGVVAGLLALATVLAGIVGVLTWPA